ncbi:NEDD8-activating enzyme E1 catalytic subunit, putative [Hepatocystis sp. ex Piliocolobus tephrosceles]|uniref:NEDD8-activating enzyme E1 catalytic subunit n=1 Tax=Piliocolobus tephrosceles TaxID=591936 RepID=A0A8C9GZM9_9PRIM|nr:NEDD8-activating enzyme E1 catalytic subunit, putative [Hepatocystis sp. ex Piliocolobus tephrosceles]
MQSGINDINVLIVGCGGLGNEVIKNLIYMNVKNISIVDYDVVEISNLQRQVFFTKEDVGSYKVDIIKKKIENKYKDICIKTYINKIEQLNISLFKEFNFIIGCLDNIESRIYLNNIIFCLEENVIYIDGGVEEFKGNIKIINKNNGLACFQCTLDNYVGTGNGIPNEQTFPICSIVNTPKTPQDCIIYVMNILFEKKKKKKFDINNDSHVKWVHEEAQKRAIEYQIDNTTFSYFFTKQVVNNIIPTIASTLMIIASLMTQELYKLVSLGLLDSNQSLSDRTHTVYKYEKSLQNYSDILYVGNNGIYIYYYKIYKNKKCVICNKQKYLHICFKKVDTLNSLVKFLHTKFDFNKVSISSQYAILYMTSKIKCGLKNYEQKLSNTFQELIDQGKITETDFYLNVQTDKCDFVLFVHLE